MLTFKAKKREMSLLEEGLHLAIITSAIETTSLTGTPQLEITFRDENKKSRKAWYNLRGYKTNANKIYTDKNGRALKYEHLPINSPEYLKEMAKRVEDPEKTQVCTDIVEKFVHDIGFKEDEVVSLSDMIEKPALILVVGSGTNGYIQYVFGTDNQKYAEEKASEILGYDISVDDGVVASL